MFDPTKPINSNSGDSEKRSEIDNDIPSGDYLIRIVWFNRQQSKAGNEYRRLKFEILAGQYADKANFTNLMSNTKNTMTAKNWQALCGGCGVTEAFHTEGPEGDKDFNKLFKNVPFKARIMRSHSGQYVNFEFADILSKDKWTEDELQVVKDIAERDLGGTQGKEEAAPADDFPF